MTRFSPDGTNPVYFGRLYIVEGAEINWVCIASQRTGHSLAGFFGELGGSGSQGEDDGQFSWPTGIAVDGSGRVYVTDSRNDRVQVFGTDGQFLTQWGSQGSGDGQFSSPTGIAVDGSRMVYVVDSRNHRVQVFTTAPECIAC